jgi:hypothetical protein
MLDSWVHASIKSGGVTETSKVVDVLLPLGGKTTFLSPRAYALFTLHTLLNAVIYCSQLNTCEVLGLIPHEWIISHRCSWMTVYVFCCNTQSKSHSDLLDICTLSLFYQLPNCNLFTQHVLFYLMERQH